MKQTYLPKITGFFMLCGSMMIALGIGVDRPLLAFSGGALLMICFVIMRNGDAIEKCSKCDWMNISAGKSTFEFCPQCGAKLPERRGA